MEQNLNYLKTFYEVAKRGSISGAAKALYISQPAISKSISKLEEEYNLKLFKRTSKGVTLTYEGNELYLSLTKAFDLINSGDEKLRNMTMLGAGKIRIGASASICKYILLPYLSKFIEKYPHIKVNIICQSSAKIFKLLQEDKLDLALIIKPNDLKGNEYINAGEFEDIFIAKKSYLENLKLRNLDSLSTKEILENGSLMLLDEENVTRVFVDDYFEENDIKVKNILEVTNMDLLIDFAKIGMGIACVLKQFVESDLENGDMVELKLNKKMSKRSIGFVYSNNALENNAVKHFVDII